MIERPRLILAIFFVGAFLLRIAFLDSSSIWLDEAISVRFALLPQSEIWQLVRETHPPLYYAGLHYWIRLFGDGETAVRIPSVIISIINLGLLYILARRLGGRNVAVVAVTLLALSPIDVWYSREARMYIFVTFVSLLMATGLSWESWLGILPYGIGLAIGLYLDYPVVLIWVCISALWFVFWNVRGRVWSHLLIWFIPAVIAWILYLPWLPNFYGILVRMNNVFLFERFRVAFNLPEFAPGTYLLLLGLTGLLLTFGTSVLLFLLRNESSRRVLTPIILGTFILVTIVVPVPRLFSVKRLVVSVWPFFVLLVAWLIYKLEQRRRQVWYGILTLSLISSLILVMLVPKDDWRGVVAYLNGTVAKSDVVWVDPLFNRTPYSYYDPVYPPKGGSVVQLSELPSADVWLVVDRQPRAVDSVSPSQAWLDDNMELADAIPFYRLEVRHYRP